MRIHACSLIAVVAVAACDTAERPALDTDAAIDAAIAPPPDTPPGPARGPVTVLVPPDPYGKVSHSVAFTMADGTSKVIPVDKTGRVSAEVVERATISVIARGATIRAGTEAQLAEIVTVTDVPANQQIKIGRDPYPESAGTLKVTTTAHSPADLYQARGGCFVSQGWDSRPTTLSLGIRSTCLHQKSKLVLIATQGGTLLAEKLIPEVTFEDGAAITADGPWQAPATYTAQIHNLSPDVEYVRVAWVGRDGPDFLFAGDATASINGSEATGSIAGVSMGTSLIMTTSIYSRLGEQHLVEPVERTSTYQLDARRIQLPWISAPTLDAAARSVSWTEKGQGDVDVVAMTIVEHRATPALELRWTVFAPRGTAPTITLPLLPSELDDLTPQRANEIYVDLIDVDSPGGYADVRDDILRMDLRESIRNDDVPLRWTSASSYGPSPPPAPEAPRAIR